MASKVYIQKTVPVISQAPVQAPVNVWYYCQNAKGYYPYIKQCPGGWQQVDPKPPLIHY